MFSVIFHREVFFWFCSFRKYTHYDHLNSLSLRCLRDTAHVETLCDSFFSSSLSFFLSSPNFSLSSPYRVLISPSCMIFHGQLTKTIWLRFKWDGHMYPVFSLLHTHTHTHTHTHILLQISNVTFFFIMILCDHVLQMHNWLTCSPLQMQWSWMQKQAQKNPRHISLNSN